MNFSRIISLGVVGIAILITVPLKVSNFGVVQKKLSDSLEQATIAILVREGFEVTTGNRYGSFLITAQQNDCQLQIQEAAAEGFDVDAIGVNGNRDARIAFEYNGKLSTSHPTIRATISKIFDRFEWKLGMTTSWSPVISITSIGHCPLNTIPWREVATIQAN